MFSTRSRLIDCSARTFALRLSKTAGAGVLAASLALSIAIVPATAAPGAADPSTTAPATATATSSPEASPRLAPTADPTQAPELTASPSPSPKTPSNSPAATPTTAADPGQELSPEAAQKLAEQMGSLGSSMGQGARKKAENINPQADVPARRSLLAAPQADTMAKAFMPAGVQGLDVSGWQTTDAAHSISSVNWTQQYSMGARFVYAKATEGNNFADASFSSQYTGATKAGLLRGAYHFALPGQSSAVAQADFFVNNGGGWTADGKTMPPLLDIEYNPYSALGNTCYNFSQSAMVTWIKDFSNRVKARTGRLPMIYTTTDWWTQCTGNSNAFSTQPLHIAAYSTVLGALPKSWTVQSVWQYSSTGPFAGDSNAWNGTEASLKTFATKADSTPPPVAPPAVAPSIPSPADVVAADGNGVLWDYSANGKGGLGSRTQIGTGWRGLRSINVIDWNADGILDIVAQWTSGSVTLYKGKLSGGFALPVTLASSGWANNQLTIGYWLNASMYPQILSRSNTGDLSLWKNNSGAGLDAGTKIGTGWGTMNLTMLDFDGDGRPDILAQNASGNVLLYRTNGAGVFVNEARKIVATGWTAFNSITVYSDFTAPNSLGLIRRTPAGALSYAPVPGNSSFGAASTIGSSWGGFLIAGAETINGGTQPPATPQPPAAPPTPTAVAGNSTATVTVAKAASGAAATSVTVTASPGNASCSIAAGSGKCSVSGLANGTSYAFRAVAKNAAGSSSASALSAAVVPFAPVARVSGADRYATSAAVSQDTFNPGVNVAYIANGATFPDALSGAAAAGSLNGPVLLAATDGLPASTQAELTRLKPKKIVILGGTGALSNGVQTALQRYSKVVSRVSGADRYETSAAISRATFGAGVNVAYIANGATFPDALSGAAAAGSLNGPVLLAATDGLPGSTQAELARLKPKRIVILGGTGAISNSVQTALTKYSASISRNSGADRYDTSAAISKATFGAGVNVVYVANGATFPDALSGAAAAGSLNGPVLLAATDGLPSTTQVELTRLKPQRIIVLGGSGAIANSVQNSLQAYVR
jgi:putative cell wall-binding protein/GH25 family lysozyme M1 (1,4-beta-N-acetylmuramidase)